MARRKGVSKTKHFGGRKIISETSHPPKEESRLKNDLGNTSPHTMDDTKLISAKKVQLSNEDQLNAKSFLEPLSHRNNSSDRISNENDIVNINKSDHKSTPEFINSNNNNNSKSFNNTSSDLKYLHKKFKRIASATLEVEAHKQGPEIVGESLNTLQKEVSKANSSDTSSRPVDCQYILVNGNAESLVRASLLDNNCKEIFLTPELNGDLTEARPNYNSFKAGSHGASHAKLLPKQEENSINSPLLKPERASPVNNNQINAINRIPLITSSVSNLPTTTLVQVNSSQKVLQQSSQRSQQREVDQNFSGRHVCPYCNLNCTKPSVLQKHIRAHTNERPYPCDTCGFAFKTKSNYYKHCRSRSHALRMKGGELQPDDDGSFGSDQDQDPDLSNSSSDVISRTASPMDERTSSPAVQQQSAQFFHKYSNEKPYKPKFHNAALYAKEEVLQQKQQNNSHSNQNQMIYYPPPVHQQHHVSESDSSAHFQQASKSRIDIGAPFSQTYQQVTSSYMDTIPLTRESTSAAFSGISATGGGPQLNREFLQEHISKIISQNEAIVENKELLLQKKYPKISNKSKSASISTSSENSNSKLALALSNKQLQQPQMQSREEAASYKVNAPSNSLTVNTGLLLMGQQHAKTNQPSSNSGNQTTEVSTSSQPLNLSKVGEKIENRKRSSLDGFNITSTERISPAPQKTPVSRPQTSERSIIKHLLLNARGLGVPNGEGEDAVYVCPLCKMEFRSAEDLRLHTSNCQGGPSSAPISPVASPSYKYFRSNSINVNLPEINNPTSLAKLARSSLLHLSRNPLSLAKLAWSQLKTKPSNLVLSQLNVNTNTTAASSSSQGDSNCSGQKVVDTPLPSPGPLLGKTPLVEAYNATEKKSEEVIITKMHEENRNFTKDFSPKRLRLNNCSQPSFQCNANDNNTRAAVSSLASYNTQINPETSQNKAQPTYAMYGGEVKLLDKKEERMKRFLSSGGCIVPISECPDIEVSPKMIRTPLLSGGSFTEVSPKTSNKDVPVTPSTTPKMMIPIAPLTPSLPAPNLLSAGLPLAQHFQFPPINSITAFNPLTLPPVTIIPSTVTIIPTTVIHGDKLIPFVPGIPGPNTLAPPPLLHPPQMPTEITLSRNASPSRKKTPSPHVQNSFTGQVDASLQQNLSNPVQRHVLQKPTIRVESETILSFGSSGSDVVRLPQRSPRSWSGSTVLEVNKKPFNFTRIADNLSPRKNNIEKMSKSPEREREVRHFNFDNLSKVEIINSPAQQASQSQQLVPLQVEVPNSTAHGTVSKEPLENDIADAKSKAKSKFLRPTSLPLKPGTFTPKRHHGITPTANTLPLISPETPRPSKACIQLYLNGHAYTYLGLKCSTKMFYCTVNCPQPSYVANLHKLSMYSVWQVCAENNPHPLGLKPKVVMSLYDSRQRSTAYSMAAINSPCSTVNSQPVVMTPFESSNPAQFYHHLVKSVQSSEVSSKSEAIQRSTGNVVVGGYESNEDYTYIRGRGRGRYVCSECGIRCKKPSMLKKHIRTHTDVRPYTCQHCSFSFKTKGNLTKHMQSKTHYKKCMELGINPGPMPPEGEYMETDGDIDQQSITSGGGRTSSIPGESDSDDYSDGGDGETESSDTDESKSRLPEHEAARCLLSLSMTPPSNNTSTQMYNSRLQYGSYQQPNSESPQTNSSGGGRHQEDNSLQSYSSRRVISFTSPKPPFDYQKQEQYYSNPNIVPKGRDEKFDESCMKPIDLRKPRQIEKEKVSEVIGDLANETGLLKSLVSNTDKIRGTTELTAQTQKLDDSVLLQAYLTEQALKYTKIKQSQMNKSFLEISSSSNTSISSVVVTNAGYEYDKPICKFTNQTCNPTKTMEVATTVEVISCAVTISSPRSISAIPLPSDASAPIEISRSSSAPNVPYIQDNINERNRSPGMSQSEGKADAGNNSPEMGLSINQCIQSQENIKEANQSPRPKALLAGTGGAKSVASEYLKMTSAEYMKSRNNKTEESEESSSDQEINVSDGTPAPIKPNSDFSGVLARTVIVGEDGFKNTSNEVQPMFPRVPISDDGRPVCTICSKTFQKQHQMVLHMNIHYMERKFKCEPCAVSFRTQGHLQKHERSEAHKNKVMMTSTFGVPTTSNPRPFECSDCKVAFRIHGHLAKHLRSKTHVQKLECLQKLPFGTYAEIERAGISLTEIDTTDCDNSLASLKALAQKLIEKDPTKLSSYTTPSCMETLSSGAISHESGGEDSPDMQVEGNESIQGMHEPQHHPSALSSSTEGSGVKRKLDSLSSCSNDLTVNTSQQEPASEKRPRTTSET